MTADEIFEKLEKRIIELFEESDGRLKQLNEDECTTRESWNNLDGMYNIPDTNSSYYHEVVRHAWALRAKKDVLGDVLGYLHGLRKDKLQNYK